MKEKLISTPTIGEWLKEEVKEGAKVGIDGWVDKDYIDLYENDIEHELRALLNRYCNKYDFLINID